MTRLYKRVVNEVGPMDLEKKIKTFSSLVKLDCKPWVNAIKSCTWPVAMRGVNVSVGKDFLLKYPVRQDRRPLDTGREVHDKVDDAFERMFKWRPRSQGLFVTGDRDDAGEYGKTYMVFPIGASTFVWSPVVDDMTHVTHSIQREIKTAGIHEVEVELKIYKYTNKNLCRALGSGNEVMVKCKAYHGIAEGILRDLHHSKMSSKSKYWDHDMNIGDMMEAFVKEYILK